MRLWEFAGAVEKQQLVALSEFLLGRADDTGAEFKISIPTFLGMASDMGVNITDSQLRDLATQEPLSNVIVNVTGDEIIFAGGGSDAKISDTMTVTQAQDTVEKMAKNALPSNLK
jgi:hypothetical protein